MAELTHSDALAQLDRAARAGQVSGSAAANIRIWLSEPRYAEYAPQVAEHLAAGNQVHLQLHASQPQRLEKFPIIDVTFFGKV